MTRSTPPRTRPWATWSARAALVLAMLAPHAAFAADVRETFKRFIDPQDGQLDLSEWLLDRKGFLPVPIIITEPAVGYGAGVALVFISGTIGNAIEKAKAEGGHLVPPDIWAVAGFATENGTRGVAIGGQFTFQDDRWRYRGGVGDFRVNLDFYGIGGRLPIPVASIGYTLQGFGSFQQGMYRLGKGDTFVGARWIYTDLSTSLDVGAGDAGLTSRNSPSATPAWGSSSSTTRATTSSRRTRGGSARWKRRSTNRTSAARTASRRIGPTCSRTGPPATT